MRKWYVVFCAVALFGCGGGGGGGHSDSDTGDPAPEGVYAGSISGGASSAFRLLVLDGGEYWALYGENSGTVILVDGFIQGTGTMSSGTFSSSNAKDFGMSPPARGRVSATFTTDAVSGKITYGSSAVRFEGSRFAGFEYDTPATLSSVAGDWELESPEGLSASVVVSASGAVSGSTPEGCVFSGTVVPRPSGKNVYNVSVAFGGAPCLAPDSVVKGIAISTLLDDGATRQLLLAGMNGDRSLGLFMYGSR